MARWKDEAGGSLHGRDGGSALAAGLTFEGNIQGTGHVRIAGSVKGDIRIQGDVVIEPEAHIAGQVRADTVCVGGEVQGNVHAGRVELLESGTLIGDLKADSFVVAPGARMRGRAEFGWNEAEATQRSISEEEEIGS